MEKLRTNDILKHHEEYRLHPDLEPLITSVILKTGNFKCLAIVCDEIYQDVFGIEFFEQIRDATFFKILVANTEDLMSPNYNTLSTIRRIRRNGCQTYVVLLANGKQVKRFLLFGDKHRDLNVRANFILMYDEILFEPELYYLWKKIVNVIFVRKYSENSGSRNWYELSTVPFPAPIKEVLIPRRIDTWRNGYFYSDAELFRDKTSNLRNQIFKVITFQHVPSAFKMPAPVMSADITVEGTEPIGYTGLEIEMLNTLSTVMNFEAEVYDVPLNEKWGSQQVNGSFSGLLGEIVSGRADIALGNLYYTPYHLDLMDLTIPYNTQCLTFLTPEALTDNSWKTLLLPFRGYLWLGVFLSLLSGAFVFIALAKFHRRIEGTQSIHPIITTLQNPRRNVRFQLAQLNNSSEFHMAKTKEKPPTWANGFRIGTQNTLKTNEINPYKRNPKTTTNDKDKHEEKEIMGLYLFEDPVNSFLYTYSMLLLVSLPKLPEGWALRIFTGWWWIYCILLVVAYRASMTSILANPNPRVTIDTLEQLAESEIPVGGWGEEIKRFFQTSLDAAGKKIGSKFEIVADIDDAIARIADGQFAYYENVHFLMHASVHRQMVLLEEAAITGDDGKNETSMVINRSLHIMRDCVINMPISLGLQKNSPLKPRIDKFLQMIVEAGLVKKWLNDAMSQVLIADASSEEQPIKALMDLKKLYGAIITLFVGYGISLLLLIGEKLFWYITVVRHPMYDKYSNSILKPKNENE
ncbi:hypothetical protein RUM44_008380 [Polyplax serrata]|uniref:Ionotropic glutamate receptor L-glutamate and glycine-binding domain-containing protein n=1 Tax=Polyplax serrata TaxID=468196 RepID=A0ABR1BC51_POLSC